MYAIMQLAEGIIITMAHCPISLFVLSAIVESLIQLIVMLNRNISLEVNHTLHSAAIGTLENLIPKTILFADFLYHTPIHTIHIFLCQTIVAETEIQTRHTLILIVCIPCFFGLNILLHFFKSTLITSWYRFLFDVAKV
jgi:hypothetical protein